MLVLSGAQLSLSFGVYEMELMLCHRAPESTEWEDLGGKIQLNKCYIASFLSCPWMADQSHFSK